MINHSKNGVRISSSLILFGEYLDPSLIDGALGVAATSWFKKGDTFSSGRGVRRNGMWCLERKVNNSSLSDDLDYFLDVIPKIYQPLTKLENVDSSRLSIWIDVTQTSSTFEISIDSTSLSAISTLGAQLFVTQFFD